MTAGLAGWAPDMESDRFSQDEALEGIGAQAKVLVQLLVASSKAPVSHTRDLDFPRDPWT